MKERIDVLLFDRGLAESREKAKAIIMSGKVSVKGVMIDKPGTKINIEDVIDVKGSDHPYVSRGGLKLEKALKNFNINVKDKIAMDVGASSGGFTDCLLQFGAKEVFSIDVGYGQFAYKLRIDERVKCIERMNFRNMPFDEIGKKVDICVMDVSFISITKLIDNLLNFLKEDSAMVLLIKPQFEASKDLVGKNGVIRDEKVHYEIVLNVIKALENKGLALQNLDFSPIKGPKGNIEFVSHFIISDEKKENLEEVVIKCVRDAHTNL